MDENTASPAATHEKKTDEAIMVILMVVWNQKIFDVFLNLFFGQISTIGQDYYLGLELRRPLPFENLQINQLLLDEIPIFLKGKFRGLSVPLFCWKMYKNLHLMRHGSSLGVNIKLQIQHQHCTNVSVQINTFI